MDPLNYMYPLPAVQSCHAVSNGWAHVASPVVSDLCLGLTSTTSEKQSTDSRCCELRSNARRLVLSDDASLDVRDNFLVRLLLSQRLRLLLGEPVLLLQLVLVDLPRLAKERGPINCVRFGAALLGTQETS